MVMALNSAGFVEIGTAYMELDPQMLCYFKSSLNTQVPCTRQDVCDGDQVLSWSVDYNSIFTLDNWII